MVTNNEYLKQMGERLRVIRKSKRVTLAVLGKVCKLKPLTICNIEHGKRDCHILTLKNIANALNVDVKEFL